MKATRVLRAATFRFALLYAALFATSVLILFGVVYWIADDALNRQLLTAVEDDAADLVDDYQARGLADLADVIERRIGSGADPAMAYLLLDAARRKIVGNLSAPAATTGWQEVVAPRANRASSSTSEQDDRRLRALGIGLSDGSLLLVGRDINSIVEAGEAIVIAFVWGLGTTVLLAIAGGFTISAAFLGRLDSINRTTRAIMDGNLAMRVPTRGTGDEVDQLAVSINEMLNRLNALMESLREVSSDIAHDLRTPLSRLRQRLETARMKARNVQDYQAAVEQAMTDTDGILATFAALLRIAQIEAGTRRAAFTTVDLTGVVLAIEEAYQPIAEDQGQSLTTTIVDGIEVHGDRELLTQMLANLVENAICHTPPGTQIRLALDRRSEGATISIDDDGPGVPVGSHEKVFQRFFRLEHSRSTPGSGLGLSLVGAVVELHGAAVTLADNRPGLRVLLAFPSR